MTIEPKRASAEALASVPVANQTGGGTAPAAARPPRAAREYLLAVGLALALYLLTMAPGLVWQDSGMSQVRVLEHDLVGRLGLALSHPLFYTIVIAFQGLPFASSAFKTNLVSVVFGTLTVANVFSCSDC